MTIKNNSYLHQWAQDTWSNKSNQALFLGTTLISFTILKAGFNFLVQNTARLGQEILASPSTWQTLRTELCQSLWIPIVIYAAVNLISFCWRKHYAFEQKPEKVPEEISEGLSPSNNTDFTDPLEGELDPDTKELYNESIRLFQQVKSKEGWLEIQNKLEENLDKLLTIKNLPSEFRTEEISEGLSPSNNTDFNDPLEGELDPDTKELYNESIRLFQQVKSKEGWLEIQKKLEENLHKLLTIKNLPSEFRTSVTHLQSNCLFLKQAFEARPKSNYSSLYRIQDKDNVIEVPGDGNCFFHSTSVLLQLLNQNTSPAQLRQNVCNYIQENVEKDWLLKTFVEDDISTFNEDLEKEYVDSINSLKTAFEFENTLEDEREKVLKDAKSKFEKKSIFTIEKYIEQSRQDGFWSGNSHLYSLSACIKKPINVIYNYGCETEYKGALNPAESLEQPLTVVHVNGNHFKAQLGL